MIRKTSLVEESAEIWAGLFWETDKEASNQEFHDYPPDAVKSHLMWIFAVFSDYITRKKLNIHRFFSQVHPVLLLHVHDAFPPTNTDDVLITCTWELIKDRYRAHYTLMW